MERLWGFMVLSLVGGGALAVLLATINLLLAEFAGRCRRLLEMIPGRAFVVGLVNFLFFFTIALVVLQMGQAAGGIIGGLFNLVGLGLLWLLLGLITLGAAGMVALLHEKRARPEQTPARLSSIISSSLWFMITLLAPIVGWFILAPLLLLTGLGAAIIVFVQRHP